MRGLAQRATRIRTIQFLEVKSGLGEQGRAITAGGVERPADGLDAGSQDRILTRCGSGPHFRVDLPMKRHEGPPPALELSPKAPERRSPSALPGCLMCSAPSGPESMSRRRD